MTARMTEAKLAALRAERQQAQEERDQIARDYEWAWQQRRQAIDALREIAHMAYQDAKATKCAREALVKLGEKP